MKEYTARDILKYHIENCTNDEEDAMLLRALDSLLEDLAQFAKSWERDPITMQLIYDAQRLGYLK